MGSHHDPKPGLQKHSRRAFWVLVALLATAAFAIPLFFFSDSDPKVASPNPQATSTAFGTVNPRDEHNEESNPSFFTFYSYDPGDLFDIPGLIDDTDAIAIGQVGEVIATEYPNSYQQGNYSPEEWSILNEDNFYVESRRINYLDFQVQETLNGTVPERFPLLSEDFENNIDSNINPIKTGEEVLLFLYVEPPPPNFTKLYDIIYSYTENGLFSIEGNRAYPRQPIAFEDTDKNYYHQTDDPLRPYFELDKLKAEIQNHGK